MKKIKMFLLAGIIMLAATAASMGNTAPVANAGAVVTLNSSDSYDPDGDKLSYSWTLTAPEGSTATLLKTAGKSSKFQTDVDGLYVIELIANDGIVDSAPDTVTVQVGQVPADADTSTLSASPTSVAADGTTNSTVTVTVKDANDNPITNAIVTLAQTGSSTISAVTNIGDGTYTFTVSSTTAETVTYTATANTVVITQTANVTFTELGSITIDKAALQEVIASIFDDTPYNPAIDIQGVIDSGGLTITVPYTVVNAPVTLPSYSTSVTLDATVTQDGETGIVATFAWEEQINLPVGSGKFNATITIDDSAGDANGIYNAKKLDIQDDSAGLVAATFSYPTDNAGGTGILTLVIMPGIPDRMFGVPDNTGDNTTHMFLYLPVTNATTGRTWLNNNLGANYANFNSSAFDIAQQATASDDHNAYGSLFQWGRKADGHELITWIDAVTGIGTNGTTSTNSDIPSDALYIIETSSPYDWRVTQDNTLWALESSTNNVCPVGYRVPTGEELNLERELWGSNDRAGALASTLVMSTAGLRDNYDGRVGEEGGSGYYWASTFALQADEGSEYLSFSASNAILSFLGRRATGMSVRCIKD